MHLASLYCVLVLIGEHGLFSIRFDEYYDTSEVPLEGFNEFNEYRCHHIGSQCTWSDQCCGPATCVLPAWSPTPVCLVPGYKEDDRLQAIAARDPIRREDVLYIRNTYNTTFYDFLLNDSLFPAPDLESTIQTFNETGGKLGSVEVKKESNDSINVTNVSSKLPLSCSDRIQSTIPSSHNVNRLIETFQNASDYSMELLEKHHVLELQDNKTYNDLSRMKEFNADFLKRFKFITVNRNLTKPVRQPNVSELFEGFKTIDDIMVTVELLNKKLNELTQEKIEIESNSLDLNTSNAHLGADKVLPSPTTYATNTLKICKKPSKWNIVKALFLRNGKNNFVSHAKNNRSKKINNYNLRINRAPDKLEIGNNTRLGERSGRLKDTILSALGDFYSRKSKKIPTALPNNKGSDINSNIESMDNEVGNNIETLKIKLPCQVENMNDDTIEDANGIAKLSTTMLSSRESSTRDSVARTSVNDIYQENSTLELAKDTNSIKNIMKSIHHWFLFPTKVNISESPGQKYPNKSKPILGSAKQKVSDRLDEYLSKLNSKSCSIKANAKSEPLQSVTSDVLTTDDTEHSASSLDYSESNDDLYNNSYVFMIKHANKTSLNTGSKWTSMLHFLHILRVPHHRQIRKHNIHRNPGKIITGKSVDSSMDMPSNLFQGVNSNSSSENYQEQRIIRIPEHLMPEALEAMQPNLTELLFSQNSYEEYEVQSNT